MLIYDFIIQMVFYLCHTSLLIIIINNDFNVEKHFIIIRMVSIFFAGVEGGLGAIPPVKNEQMAYWLRPCLGQ